MRIISQELVDFPHEQIFIGIDENRVMCKLCSQPNAKYLLGEYESNERAIEVFHEINEQFHKTPLMDDGVTLYNQTTFVMPDE